VFSSLGPKSKWESIARWKKKLPFFRRWVEMTLPISILAEWDIMARWGKIIHFA
jgi:hypothetical protein